MANKAFIAGVGMIPFVKPGAHVPYPDMAAQATRLALADAGVNIATFHLGRSAPGGDAICLVGLDGPMPEGVLDGVRKLPLVVQATALAF